MHRRRARRGSPATTSRVRHRWRAHNQDAEPERRENEAGKVEPADLELVVRGTNTAAVDENPAEQRPERRRDRGRQHEDARRPDRSRVNRRGRASWYRPAPAGRRDSLEHPEAASSGSVRRATQCRRHREQGESADEHPFVPKRSPSQPPAGIATARLTRSPTDTIPVDARLTSKLRLIDGSDVDDLRVDDVHEHARRKDDTHCDPLVDHSGSDSIEYFSCPRRRMVRPVRSSMRPTARGCRTWCGAEDAVRSRCCCTVEWPAPSTGGRSQTHWRTSGSWSPGSARLR